VNHREGDFDCGGRVLGQKVKKKLPNTGCSEKCKQAFQEELEGLQGRKKKASSKRGVAKKTILSGIVVCAKLKNNKSKAVTRRERTRHSKRVSGEGNKKSKEGIQCRSPHAKGI